VVLDLVGVGDLGGEQLEEWGLVPILLLLI
jgi:hypothetical protein